LSAKQRVIVNIDLESDSRKIVKHSKCPETIYGILLKKTRSTYVTCYLYVNA